MSKKKEQVRYLKKSFAAALSAFKREKDKQKRKEAFEFLSGRMAEFRTRGRDTEDATKLQPGSGSGGGNGPAGNLVPSPALVEEIRSEHRHEPAPEGAS